MVEWGVAVVEALGVAVLFVCMASILYDALPTNEPERTGGGGPYPESEYYRRSAHSLPCPYKRG